MVGGFARAGTDEWVSGVSYAVVGAKPGEEERMPRVGDRLRITDPCELIVLDFGRLRERNRLVSPAGLPRTEYDYVGTKLFVGDLVEVKEVARKTLFDLNRDDIYFRVAPVLRP
jgi:hypothetical protein